MNSNELTILQTLLKKNGLDGNYDLSRLTHGELIDLHLKLQALNQTSYKDYVPEPKQKEWHLSKSSTRLILGGNRSGKTIAAFHDVIWQLTGDYPDWYLDDMKLETPVYSRWIATDYKQGVGGVFQPYFKDLIPKSLIKRVQKTQQGIICKVFWKNGSELELLTDEQDVGIFEGWHGHRLHVDEPCARSRYIASKRGLIDYGGKSSFSLTPLKEPWIYDELYEQADGNRIFAVTIDIEENPHIPKEEIDEFKKSLTDDEKEARIHGRFSHLTGIIYKEFEKDVHIIPDRDIPKNWPTVHLIDPHDRKPHANVWVAVDEFDNLYFYDELESSGTIPQISAKIRLKEFKRKADIRIGDPNKMMSPPKIGSKGSLKSEFAQDTMYTEDEIDKNQGLRDKVKIHGLHFSVNVNNSLDAGHLKVKRYLMYDKTKPIGIGNRPKIYFFKSCVKTIRGMTHYIWDDHRNAEGKSLKEKPKDEFKDFPDLVRYACMSNLKYSSPNYERNIPGGITGYGG